MKVYVPMKLNPVFMMRKDSFTDFAGLHYKNEDDARQALQHIQEQPATLGSKGYGPFCAQKASLPTVSAICTINVPDYEWQAHINNDEMQVPTRFGECYKDVFTPSQVDEIRINISADALHPASPTYIVRAVNGFDTSDIATELESRAEGLQRLAEALERSPAGLRMQITPEKLQNAQDMYSHRGIAFNDNTENLGTTLQSRVLKDLCHVTSVDAGLHANQFSELFMQEVSKLCPAGPSTEWQYAQTLANTIKAYANELQPLDYAKAMELYPHAAQYVRTSIDMMKSQGPEGYLYAYQDRVPVSVRREMLSTFVRESSNAEMANPGASDNMQYAMHKTLNALLNSDGISAADANQLSLLVDEAAEDLNQIRDELEFDESIE